MNEPEIGLGLQLKQAREARGLSIGDVAAVTRISERGLEAIERERFDRLPDGLFRRSYIRAYAETVGLDASAVVRAYRDRFEASGDDLADEGNEWPRPSVAIAMAMLLAVILLAVVVVASMSAPPPDQAGDARANVRVQPRAA
jgi:cytoskeletal protein RodZ